MQPTYQYRVDRGCKQEKTSSPDVKTDAPHLGRITHLVRIQPTSWFFETQQERQDSGSKTMANIAEHYFNTGKGVHGSCEELCPKNTAVC